MRPRLRARILSVTGSLICLFFLTPLTYGQGTWTFLTGHPPSGVNSCLLLTDGGVMCQADTSWYKLTPDSNGSYVNGTWTTLASFPAGYGPTDYGSAVLADGRVVVIGGEYSFGNFTLSNTVVVYDPVADSWTTIAPPVNGSPNHFQCMGDVPTVVLPNGKLLVGTKLFPDLALLDPATLTWSIVSASGKIDPSNAEEGWTLLPDGTIFTLDVARAPASERLLIAGLIGTWVTAGNTLQDLHTPPTASDGPLQAPGCPVYNPPGEMGPALLRPDGSVFAVGADGSTGIFTPPAAGSTAPGTWTIGPAMPSPLNVQDGPAALLPSGHVLFGGSPGEDLPGLQYFEFDGANLISVSAPLASSQDDTESTELLLLPTGQVLFIDGTQRVQVYTASASPTYNPAWAPTISSVPSSLNNGTTYQVTGTQLNGLSQGTAYGDEEENGTNYPLVRITNNSTGHVVYARTHDHSTMAVATGNTPVTTSFDVPINIEAGPSILEVVANGIPSVGVSVTIFTPILPLTVSTTSLPDGVVGVPYSVSLVASGGVTPYTFQLSSGQLPAGLTLNTQTGQISGTPSSATSNSLLTFKIKDSGSPTAQTATVSLILTVAPLLSILTTSLPNALVGIPYTGGLSATGGIAPYTWQVTGGTLPAGLTLNSQTGQITGSPTGGPSNNALTFGISDSTVPTAQTASVSLSLPVFLPHLTTNTTSLPNGVVGVAYVASISVVGGLSPFTWQVTGGSLPAGLSLNSQTGAITGTPTVAVSNSSLTFTITDSSLPPQIIAVNLTLTIAPVLTITTPSLPSAQLNVPYSTSIAVTGGVPPYTWQLSAGTLPAGLTLNTQTGAIGGTPTSITSFTPLIFKVTDSSVPNTQTATAGLGIAVVAVPVAILTAALPAAQVGTGYSVTLQASGGITPYTWQLSSGVLPAGLTLNSQTGLISGTPTTPGGLTPLTFKVTDASLPVAQTASTVLNLLVTAGVLTITTTSLPNGQINVPYSATVTAVNGVPPYTWSARRLPTGLTFNSQNGQITGTPTDLGTTTLSFTVTDSSFPAQSANVTLSITIVQATGPIILTASLPSGQVGVPYSTSLSANGGTLPYTWQLMSGTLPGGLTLSAQTGQITGAPTAPVTNSPLTFKVSDSGSPAQSATVSLSLTITQVSGPTILTTSLPNGQVGAPYSIFLIAIGGSAPYSWQLMAGALPAGLSLNTQTGQINGTPAVAVSNSPLTFRVSDSTFPTAQTASSTLNLTILPANFGPLTILTSSLPNGLLNVPYSTTLTASGGVLPYTWSTRRLPPGFSLNPQTGAFSGTSSTLFAGTLLVFTVTDSSSTQQSASVTLSFTVTASGLSITTVSLPNAQITTAYSASLTATGGTTPYTWQLSAGTLPGGLSLNSQTGQISGTPTTLASNTPLTFRVTDSSVPAQSATATFTLTVTSAIVLITSTSLPTGQVNVPYSAAFSTTGGKQPFSWQITSGTLPAGLTLNTQTGQITGTPTVAVTNLPLTFKVTDSTTPIPQSSTVTLPLTITQSAPTGLTILTTSLPSGQVNVPYSATLTAVGGVTPYTWSTRRLPQGLVLNASTGQITGTPVSAVSGMLLVFTVTDSSAAMQTENMILSLTINP